MGHFMGDAEGYRPETDAERARELDSIETLAADLRDHGVGDDERTELRNEAAARVDEVIEWAKGQPEPDPEAAYEDVFAAPIGTPRSTVGIEGGEE